jgi:pSer/pThr/pTyr-binding forkhead associated (FHA) protein
MATSEDKELKQRLGLYQVFLRLYEHHRGLLDEILKLENIGLPTLSGVVPQYIQGMVQGQQVSLMTNLREGETQILHQPQRLWTIGRHRSCAIPIADKQLSRRHAVIQYIDHQGFYLVDLDSTNGSFVNGEPLVQRLLLKDGDQIRLGGVTFSFFIAHSSHTLADVSPEVISHLAGTSLSASYELASDELSYVVLGESDLEIPTAPVEEEIPPQKGLEEDTSLFLKRQRATQQASETTKN